jgi:hypothetical protein
MKSCIRTDENTAFGESQPIAVDRPAVLADVPHNVLEMGTSLAKLEMSTSLAKW